MPKLALAMDRREQFRALRADGFTYGQAIAHLSDNDDPNDRAIQRMVSDKYPVEANVAKIWLRSLAPYAAVLEAAARVIDDDDDDDGTVDQDDDE